MAYKDISILLAEDTNTMRRFVRGVLQDLGFQKIYEAKDGKVAMEILENHDVDCIISDWEMPEVDGLELLRHVRNSSKPKLKNCPFIMVTGVTEKENVVSAAKENVTGYITKPFTTESLTKRITQFIPQNLKSPIKSTKGDTKDCIVLLVESNNLMRRLVKKYLLELQYNKILEAKTSNDAFELIANNTIGLVISAWETPQITGIQLLKLVRNTEAIKNIPFLAMAAEISKDEALKAKNEKLSGFITTPFKQEQLKEKLNSIIKAV